MIMTYIEMCFKIKELLFNIATSLDTYNSLIIFYNGYFMSGNLRGDMASISHEINEYLIDLIKESQTEMSILTKLDNYITKTVLDYTAVFFEDSEEFHLFEHIIKRINNSYLERLKSSIYVIQNYNNLINLNGFNNNNYKIIKRKKYISDAEYQSYLHFSI